MNSSVSADAKPKTPRSGPRLFWPLIVGLSLLGGGVAVLCSNAEARELVTDTIKSIFVIVTTPFVFETTFAILFVMALMLYNRWRLQKDGDGWVYMVDQEASDDLPKALTERLHNTILEERPEAVDEGGTRISTIEGFLELGMGAQALSEFEPATSWPDGVETAQLHIRVLAAAADDKGARELLHRAIRNFPEQQPSFAATALEIARWMLAHRRETDSAKSWYAEAMRLDSSTVAPLAANDPLQRLLKG